MGKKLIAGVLASGFIATSAAAEFTGGALSFDHVIKSSYNTTALQGSAVLALSNGLFIQGDVGGLRQTASVGHAGFWGAHLGMELDSGTRIGGLAGLENWMGGRHLTNYGIELQHDFGQTGGQPLLIEGYLVRQSEASAPFAFTGFGLEAAYGLSDSSSLNAALFSSGGALERTRLSVGLNYTLASNLNLGLEATHINRPGNNANALGLTVGYKFGSGGLFGSRNSFSYLPGE
ncbi:MAG: hypothetical protein WBA91_11230 [Paracoccaceae bacterium]